MGRALGGKPLVLVVEDDAVTRMAAMAMLDSAGYEVVEADSGSSAVQELMRVPGIRVILTDIDM
ncbi:response regulator [Methylobacterium sp. J-070]|uniref:response regulator n=1 Tax=Methylobacterium sp. J-070 TaxID=2836650 RepID=UPI001FBB0580|nr:response regulator [Methylobacterium sp. J-070]MCJ2054082.1 response regulator [Methylobacterium sp. J-070]